MPQSHILANRYGAQRRSMPPWGWWVVAGAGIAVLAAFLLVTSLRFSSSFDAKDVSYQIKGDRSADVTVAVSMDPDDDVTCGVRALSQDFSVVGYREVRFQATDQHERSGNRVVVQHTVPLRTTFTPVSAGYEACWRTDS